MPSSHREPYISVVVTARNDNHGINMLGRMQAFLDSWMEQAKGLDLDSEIVVVEWNPPANRPPLRQELQWPDDPGPCAVRFIEVPREVHASIPNAAGIPLHQMIAKNAGIRRARGEFVLATNLDIIFSAELMRFLAERKLQRRAMYRMDRLDVASEIPPHGQLEELLSFCQGNILRVCAREGVWEAGEGGVRVVEADDIVSADSGIRLGAGWYGLERPDDVPQRYIEPVAGILLGPPPAGNPPLLLLVEPGPSARDAWIELAVFDHADQEVASAIVDGQCELRLTLPEGRTADQIRLRTRNGGVALLRDPRMLDLRVFRLRWEEPDADSWQDAGAPTPAPAWKLERIHRRPGVDWAARGLLQSPHFRSMRKPVYLHTNGCGDFTMLSRDAWLALRGYPEFPVWPTHIDSLTCYAAYHAGFPEIILRDPLRIFHIQHEAVWTPETEQERKARAAARGVQIVDYESFVKYIHHMRRFNVPVIFSGEDWGLAGIELPESVVEG